MKTYKEFILERNRFEKQAEKNRGLPFSDEELQRQRNQRHLLNVPGGIGSRKEDPELHDATVINRRDDNRIRYQTNTRKNRHERIVVDPIVYGSGPGAYRSANTTNQYITGTRADPRLLSDLRRRRLERTFNKPALAEEFKDLSPEKEQRVYQKLEDIRTQNYKELSKVRGLERIRRFIPIPGIRRSIRQRQQNIIDRMKTLTNLGRNAGDSLTRTNVSRSVATQKRIEDLKKKINYLKDES